MASLLHDAAAMGCRTSVRAHGGVPRRVASLVKPRGVQCDASKAKFFVGGNWKCNHNNVDTLLQDLNAADFPTSIDVVVAPPFVYLDQAKQKLKPQVQISAQNCWVFSDGAWTGEVSAEMLRDMAIPWVILGHSERRALFNETSELVARKTAHALECGLNVIACIGETLEERNQGRLEEVLTEQMQALVDGVKDWSKVVIAYEPVWAIGTGVVATPEQAQDVHAYLRQWLESKLGREAASTIRIIYGGSVNDKNCFDLAVKEDVDGFLVGGASLNGKAFGTICSAAPKY